MSTIGSPLYFFSIGVFSLLFVYQFFIWLGRREEMINLAFCIISLTYIGVITLSRMDFLRQHLVRHILPISITIIISIVIPFIGYVFLRIHELKKFFFYSSVSVVVFSTFMIVRYFIRDVSVPLTAVYYAYVAIWPTLGTVLVFYYFIRNKRYKHKYDTALFIGYLIIMLSLVAQLIPTILDLGMGPTFMVIQTFPLVVVILLLSLLSSKRFNQEYKELIELKTSLERKVTERTKELQEAQRQKTDFFINFAHEIKTPVLLIQNYLNRHIEYNGSTEDLAVAKENIETMAHNIINTLDFEKLEKKLPLYNHQKTTDISTMLSRKISVYELPIIQNGLSVTSEIQQNCFIKFDPFGLDRIFNNLLDNAIRYNREGGSISVSLKSQEGCVTLAVSDTGAGIPTEKITKIFEPYYQISHKKRNIQGIGVGLNIVKRIMEDAGGSIDVTSSLNMGTVFTLTFRAAAPSGADETPEVSHPPHTFQKNVDIKQAEFNRNKKSLLIVEDNIQHLAFLQTSLQEEYNVFYADNGREALGKLPDIPVPDLILCDIMMDEMDGFECLEELSDSEKYSGIPFIFISALTGEEEKLRALSTGAIDFISKPYALDELKNKIKSIIKLDETREQQQLSKIEHKIISVLHDESLEESRQNKVQDNFRRYKLSPREIDVVQLILEGYEHKEIGYGLEMSVNTLKTHIKNIYSKCGVQNKIELVNKIRD